MRNKSGKLYLDIYQELCNKIKNGEYAEGDKMPTEREMCEIYNVSRITIRQAFSLLEEEGYLYRKQGKGSFVRKGRFNQNINKLYSLRNEFNSLGLLHYTKMLSFEKMRPDILVSHRIAEANTEFVYKICRLFFVDNRPYTVETNYIPCNLFDTELTQEMIEQNGLYNTLTDLQYPPTNATEKLRITLPNKTEAALLQCKSEDACMLLQRTTYSNGTLIEYSTNIVKGDIFEYTVQL